MLNFYKVVKENLSFNRFQYRDIVCLEYTCPIEVEHIGIFSRNDYIVHVLSGKKTYVTSSGQWTLAPGQTLYLRKGAEIIHQYFDDAYCMLGFFLSDEFIRETFNEVKGSVPLQTKSDNSIFVGREVATTGYLEGFFLSMLHFFRDINRPPDQIMLLRLKEMLLTLMNADPILTTYFREVSESDGPSIRQIMEANFCFNLNMEEYADLSHRSLSTFKRDFQRTFGEAPGKWLLKRRVQHAAYLLSNTSRTVTEVAFDSGFEDVSHFSRSFKSIMGIKPSEFKH